MRFLITDINQYQKERISYGLYLCKTKTRKSRPRIVTMDLVQ